MSPWSERLDRWVDDWSEGAHIIPADLATHYASRRRPPLEPVPNPDALPIEEIERRWQAVVVVVGCGCGALNQLQLPRPARSAFYDADEPTCERCPACGAMIYTPPLPDQSQPVEVRGL